ncbi:MAG: hypothetical protein SOI56_05105 [Eubacteriales bacterium]
MTVEASVIIPCIVIITAALIFLTYYIHNRNWYTMAAWESAMVGNARYTEEDEISLSMGLEAARERARQRADEQTMPGKTPTSEVTSDERETTVSYSGLRYAMFKKFFSDTDVSEKVERIWPVHQIRSARNARKLVEDLAGVE